MNVVDLDAGDRIRFTANEETYTATVEAAGKPRTGSIDAVAQIQVEESWKYHDEAELVDSGDGPVLETLVVGKEKPRKGADSLNVERIERL